MNEIELEKAFDGFDGWVEELFSDIFRKEKRTDDDTDTKSDCERPNP